MGKYNIAVCNYLSDNDRFAELVNVSEFGGRPVLRGDMLESDDGHYTVLRPKRKQKGKQAQPKEWFRDIKKRTKNGDWIVIAAIENQENVDYTMPLRMMEYDLLEYNAQVRELEKDKAKTIQESGKVPCDWNTRLDKDDKIHPAHSICFYHGTEPWDGPRSLKDMMDFKDAPPGWEELFHDYGMSLFCAGEVEDLSVFQTGLRQFLEVIPLRDDKDKLDALLSGESYQHLDRETAETIAIITDSTVILERLDEYETGGEYNMCKAMDDLKTDLQAKELLKNIRSLMKTMRLTIDQAMDALEVPEEDRDRYRAKI